MTDAERRPALRALAGLTGDRSIDALFPAMLDLVLDPLERERLRLRRHMFLARFGRQSLLQWEHVESRMVNRYVKILAEFLREEGDEVKRVMREGSASG